MGPSILESLEKVREALQGTGPLGQRAWADSERLQGTPKLRLQYCMEKLEFLRALRERYRRFSPDNLPVGAREFVESPKYLDRKDTLYPKVMDEFVELNCGRYVEALLTGGIGTGKTTVAIYSQAYQLYLLSCMRSPHKEFDISPDDEIEIIFQSVTATLAKNVDFMRFQTLIERSPYFRNHFMFDPNITSELRFPKRIIVKPVSGLATAALGQNVIGGIIDELNFMAMVQQSTKNPDGATYDQAVENYNAIARRRKSRFMKAGGSLPGMLCLVSSRRYPGQFTDKKEQEAKTDPTIYVYDKRVWEIKPEGSFCGKNFWLFVGDETRNPRILPPSETKKIKGRDRDLLMEVPTEYKKDFENNIHDALRDIAGVSTLALHPFMPDHEAVRACFNEHHLSILSRDTVDFQTTSLLVYPREFRQKEEPRWCHLDLAVTGDSAGVAIGYCEGFRKVKRGDETEEEEILPLISFDCLLEVKPPPAGEINFSKIRNLIYKLREMGLNIRWVSADTFQSTDTLQILSQRGFISGIQSMDKLNHPYDIAKQAMMDRRVRAPWHAKAIEEWAKLERDMKTNRIDHPPNGSKDISDAMAGVVFGISMRRETWLRYGVPLTKVPDSFKSAENKGAKAVSGREGKLGWAGKSSRIE